MAMALPMSPASTTRVAAAAAAAAAATTTITATTITAIATSCGLPASKNLYALQILKGSTGRVVDLTRCPKWRVRPEPQPKELLDGIRNSNNNSNKKQQQQQHQGVEKASTFKCDFYAIFNTPPFGEALGHGSHSHSPTL
ncbi:hypothetical protein AWZ03_012063 [Drosophila navojoa]|uniref:Uncharacterized protein n=1 Tax=Drosophila navojoa TaxID=7232 RepID=A0A484AYS3_DRONA|nr:hypothetical protein AWZ03_012063 [Drosophila navojoa]